MTTAPRIAKGGKAIYGAPLGILMLDARFPRIPGDMGNAGTWPFPVLYRVVTGATPERVVLEGAAGLLPDFLAAASELVAQGAEAITTNCGFLSLFQAELAAHVRVPVATSALLQVPWVQATLPPGKRVGIVYRVRGIADAAASGGGGCAGGYARRWHGRRAGVFPRADSGGQGGYGCRFGGAGRPGRGRAADACARRYWGDRAGMHQHAALCARRAGCVRRAGVRYLFVDYVVSCRAAATAVLGD